MTVTQLIDSFAQAIAYAEGFYINGSRAQRNNNPGNLTVDVTGNGIGTDGTFIIYATATDGWYALKTLIAKMIDGTSIYYNSSMSIWEIAQIYTTTQQIEWATNVASRLGVTIDTTLDDLLTPATVIVSSGVILLLFALWYLYKHK